MSTCYFMCEFKERPTGSDIYVAHVLHNKARAGQVTVRVRIQSKGDVTAWGDFSHITVTEDDTLSKEKSTMQ